MGQVSPLLLSVSALLVGVALGDVYSSPGTPWPYPFVCNGKGVVLQHDGVYRFQGFSPEEEITFSDNSLLSPSLTKVNGDWSMSKGDKILHTIEWEQKCFVLISTQNGSFSSIYSLHGDDLRPVFRQQMRNYGVATSAKFFPLRKSLYLIITNDNAVHSLTICPLLRWAGTYMDEIHAIQTRGASAVETFTINSKEYVAIAQSQDASGNFEVGTQILRMDEKEDLEKVQVLWSNHPVALQHVQVLHEHYLIIGQAKEPSIAYLFGGLDFIPVQNLKTYHGSKLFMDSYLLPLPDRGPVLLAATNTSIHYYTWSIILTSLSLNNEKSAIPSLRNQEIARAKFLRIPGTPTILCITLTDSKHRPSLKFLNVALQKKEIAESQVKEAERPLSQCLIDVKNKLEEDTGQLCRLMEEKDKLLRVDGDVRFEGTIHVSDSVRVKDPLTTIQQVSVNPDLNKYQDESLVTPSELLKKFRGELDELRQTVMEELPHILMSNKAGVISGDYTFKSELEVGELNAPGANLELESLNNKTLDDIREYALRKYAEIPQAITGDWIVEKLVADNVTSSTGLIGDVNVNSFLLQKCPETEKDEDFEGQEVNDIVTFKQSISIPAGIIMTPEATVNGIQISNVVLKNHPIKDIQGFKHVKNLVGGDNFTFGYINGKNFLEWYDSVLHIDDPPQTSSGTKTISGKIDNFDPEVVNGHNWEEFYENVLRNSGDQDIEGNLEFENLEVNENLDASSIASVAFTDLLTSADTETRQEITSNITVRTLTVNSNLDVVRLNDISPEEDLIKKTDEYVEITGPVELQDFKVSGDVTISEYKLIGGKDVSDLGKLRRRQIYSTKTNRPIIIRADMEVENVVTETLNGNRLEDDIQQNFWSKTRDNSVIGPLDLSGRSITVRGDFRTGTLNEKTLETDFIRLGDNGEPIGVKLNFVGDVIVIGDVIQSEGKILNKEDFSKITEEIVRVGEGVVITGMKTFTKKITAQGGLVAERINSFRIPEDLVFLDRPGQYVYGKKVFKGDKVLIKSLKTDVDIETGTVNDVDLKFLGNTTAYKDAEQLVINGDIVFNTSLSASWIEVRKDINGVDARDVFDNIISLEEVGKIQFPILVKGDVKVSGPANVENINGIIVKDYLSRVVVSRREAPDYTIFGTKTFLNLVIDGDLSCDLVNGVNLTDLHIHAFSLREPQNVTGTFTVDSVIVDGDIAAENIDGINTSDLVYVDDPLQCQVDSDIVFQKDVDVSGPVTIGEYGSLNGYPANLLSEETGAFGREIGEVEVTGDVSWEYNRDDIKGISHLYENAVTLDTDQVITAPVTFVGGFYSESLEAYPWIEDVNLSEIAEDAVNFGEYMEIHGRNTFEKPVTATGAEISVGNLNAAKLNGTDLKEFLRRVVRKDEKEMIFGTKTFPYGLNVTELLFKDLNGKGDYKWLVTISDNRTIDHLVFSAPLKIVENLDFNRSKGFDLEDLLASRIATDGDTKFEGNLTIPSLTVEDGNCNPEFINGVKVSDIVRKLENEEKLLVGGKKTFKNGVSVEGSVHTEDLNGYNFAHLYKDVYRLDEPENLTRPITFVEPVEMESSLYIGEDFNDHALPHLSQKIEDKVKEYESRALAKPDSKPSAEKLTEIQRVAESLPQAPYWLEYVKLKQNWTALGPQSRVEYTDTPNGGIIALHQDNNEDLEPGCVCNNVRFVDIYGPTITTSRFYKCVNAFVVTAPEGKVYSIFDRSESYNRSCTLPPGSDDKLVIANDADDYELLIEPSKGFLSDAKAFRAYQRDYLILSYFFDAESQSHESFTYVYRVDNAKYSLQLIQKIPSFGPLKIDVFDVREDWYLGIVNNRNPYNNSILTHSTIHKWSHIKEQFILLQEIKTNGAVDVVIFDLPDRNLRNPEGSVLYFTAFAQSGNTGDGEVLILQYNETRENFGLTQTLRTEWSVTALEYICVTDNCFLILVIPQKGVLFFEYRYVEGFQLVLTVPIVGAMDAAAFSWGQNMERIEFAVASTRTSLLTEGVVAGTIHYNEEDGLNDPYEHIPMMLNLTDTVN